MGNPNLQRPYAGHICSRRPPDRAHLRLLRIVGGNVFSGFALDELGEDTKQTLHDKYHRTPTLEEIAEASGLDTERVLAALEAPSETVSLDRPVGEDGAASLQDFVEDDNAADPEAMAASAWRRDRLIKALQVLDREEQQVLWLRFGLDGDEPWTLSDVGNVINSTRERVRQIEARGLAKLRHPSCDIDLQVLL